MDAIVVLEGVRGDGEATLNPLVLACEAADLALPVVVDRWSIPLASSISCSWASLSPTAFPAAMNLAIAESSEPVGACPLALVLEAVDGTVED
jgi:hypothetical protein